MPLGTIIQRAREDSQRIVEGGFSVELLIETNYTGMTHVPDLEVPHIDESGELFTGVDELDSSEVTIQGLATRHRDAFDPENGLPVVGLNCHCTISEKTLNSLGYGTRTQDNILKIRGWKVSWDDNLNTVTYKIEEPSPDETLGIIKCILGEFDNG